jgi:3-dehydroquinate dehydratase I
LRADNNMSARETSSVLNGNPQVVGTIHSPNSLKTALRLERGELDFLELRVDAFSAAARVLAAAPELQIPLIVTVRHPAEGGAQQLGLAERRELFGRFLPYAAMIDVEVRSLQRLGDTIAEARHAGVRLICSDHHFRAMPSITRLNRTIWTARSVGAHVCKIAALAETARDIGRLLALFTRKRPIALSVMGMGVFGKVSRLLFAQAGSVLNYGYLDKPNASGQWEATLLKKRLSELTRRQPS